SPCRKPSGRPVGELSPEAAIERREGKPACDGLNAGQHPVAIFVEDKIMDRRKFLFAGSVGATSAAFPAPAISQGIRELKLRTSGPETLPGAARSAERVGRRIPPSSGGRLKVTVFPAGKLVGAFEIFDAVSSGVADMYHSAEYYWEQRAPGFNFFAAVPFGFT